MPNEKLTPEEREAALRERLERIEALEREIKERERAIKAKEGAKSRCCCAFRPHSGTRSLPGRRRTSAP